MRPFPIHVQYMNSPCGELVLAEFNSKLCMCDWARSPRHPNHLHKLLANGEIINECTPFLETVKSLLEQYFQGEKVIFDIPLNPIGTDFQKEVWKILTEIPVHETRTYGEIARLVHRPSSIRAVANAIGSNPLSIIIPCHRVIGKNGRLTGYAGGIAAKKFLLELEKVL